MCVCVHVHAWVCMPQHKYGDQSPVLSFHLCVCMLGCACHSTDVGIGAQFFPSTCMWWVLGTELRLSGLLSKHCYPQVLSLPAFGPSLV